MLAIIPRLRVPSTFSKMPGSSACDLLLGLVSRHFRTAGRCEWDAVKPSSSFEQRLTGLKAAIDGKSAPEQPSLSPKNVALPVPRDSTLSHTFP